MATEEEPDALKLYWDHFFKAETGTYEKSTWLDLFLAEFLIRVKDGANPKELIKFCPVSGVVTLVGCELLCGIHRVTSSINTHYTPPLQTLGSPCSGKVPDDDEKTENEEKSEEPRIQSRSVFARANALPSGEILRKYLLGGVAWRCLVLLRALGVEGLSCCRQLSSVLIWLYGELSGATAVVTSPPTTSPAASPAPVPRTPVHQLFSHRIWSKYKPSVQTSKSNSIASSEKGTYGGRSRLSSHRDSPDKSKRKISKHSDDTSETGESSDDLQILNRSLAIKVCTPNDDFEYFNSSLRSSNEYPDTYTDPYYSPRKAKLKADDYMNERHKEIINSEITDFEFTLIITDLLQELCKAESSLSGSEGSQISMQCINFSLRNLCSLQFTSLPTHNNQQVSRIKVALMELLIVSLDKVLIHSDLCAKLINSGILPMMLRLLEDVITKNSNKKDNRAKEIDKTESENLLKFVFGIAYSVTAFFHCLLMQCRSVEKLREFTDQFKLYGECLKGGLLKECIELMIRIRSEEEDVVILIKKLIEIVGKLINGMKKVRSEVIHSAACPRSRHKACRVRVAAGMHHHHDILGEASTDMPMSSACCISVLYNTLTSLLTDEEVSAQSILRNKILRVMLNCGVCCCFSPGILMESIVRLMLTHNTVASLCLQVLEHTVYGELGASVLIPKVTDQLPCSICEPCEDKRDSNRRFCQHGVGPVERKSVWSFLIHYNSLLQLDNHNNVLHATVSHLLRVTPKCRMEMKYELLFSVIYPTFIVAKHRYIIRMEESAYFLTVSCLNIFASLLNTVTFAEQFIQKGGLSYVLELVSLPEFSNQCCSILEIAIIVEIFKLMKENSEMTYYREMNSLSSVQMLFKSLSDVTDKCFNVYKTKLPIEKFEELIDVSKERESLAFVPLVEHVERKVSMPQPIKSNFVCTDDANELSMSDHVELLKNVWTFWKTCAGLCLYSPMFREYMVGENATLESYALLKVVLYCLCSCDCGVSETRLLLKILEALLTVQLAVADVTSGRSKETSCDLVRRWVVCEAAALDAGGRLRPLCEAVLRAAAARPSHRHAMPRLTHAKVPPLVCASGSSSAECSSSEESAPALYASEHSDTGTTRPDDGYEADVEIAKFDLLPSHKTRKISNMTSISVPGLQTTFPETLNMECGEYTKNGELAHPELCIIVVDILTQLIDKVMKQRAAGGATSPLCAAACRLSRACVSRLAGPRPPPPALLQRLLAPPTQELLSCDDDDLQELVSRVLELVVGVGRGSLGAAELGCLLRCAARARPPLRALLPALQRLLPDHAHTPDHLLTFPIRLDPTDSMQYLAEDFVHLTVNGVSSQSHAAEATARKLQEAHLKAGISSCWSRGACHAGVAGGWPGPWMAGFGLMLWLGIDSIGHTNNENSDDIKCDSSDSEPTKPEPKRTNKPSDKFNGTEPEQRTELSHVFSIGHDSLMFELWLDTQTGSLVVRLSRPEAGGPRAVSAGRTAGVLRARWACLALNVRERLQRRALHMHVTIYVNGHEFESMLLPVQGVIVRKSSSTHIVVGHAGGRAGVYHLAAAAVYRAPAFTAPLALHLAAHGPDSSCMVRCEPPNYSSLLTPEVLDSGIDWDQVFDLSESTLRSFHDSLLLQFSADSPALINLYHTTSQSAFPGGSGGAAGAGGPGAGASIPEALGAVWAGAPLPSAHRGLTPALYAKGGIHLLLYLYARVVELNAGAAEQATALKILLRARTLDARLHAGFDDTSYDMLLAVLAAPTAAVTPHLLKVILDESCSSSVLRVSGGVGVSWRSDAALLDPSLLQLLVKAAATLDDTQEYEWEVEGSMEGRCTERGSVWSLALTCICALVRPDHPRREFNLYQMGRKDIMNLILLACKERLLNSSVGRAAGGGRVVWAVRALLARPPALHPLAALADFLLLMHQASDTFVTHSRANFYFLLTSETREMSGFDTVARRKSTRRNTKSGTEDTTDNTPEEDSDRMDSSLDSTKQLKGIINMNIREARKHNMSSTSETSDTTTDPVDQTEGSENGRADDGHPPLTDYVVVEQDDLRHTTVEMYSSGIFHQSKVRAGAGSEWAACEGLLLLLRDAILQIPEYTIQNLPQGVCSAVAAECVCALGNHPAGGVRAAVVRCARALRRRANPELTRRLQHHHYWTHLANQISLYEGSWELAEACAELITDCDLPLQDQLDEEVWSGVTSAGVLCSPPLLALLPVCLHDVPLAHNVARLIARLVDKATLKLIGEICLVEVVVRTIRAVGAMAEGEEGRELLLDDLGELLEKVAVKGLAAQHTTQTIVEMHHMLTYVEWEGEEGAAQAARAAQSALYLAQIDWLERRHDADHARSNNYFANVLSSAVSLGGGAGESGARLTSVAARAVAHLTRGAARAELPPADLALLLRLLGGVGARRMWAGTEGATALAALGGWALSRRGAAGAAVLRALFRAAPAALRPLAPDPPAARRLAVYLLTTLKEVHLAAEEGPAPLELAITDWARGWALALQAGLPDRLHSESLALEAESYLKTDEERWARAAARMRPAVAKVVFSKESLALRVTETAMAATRVAVETQNAERKRFMELLRAADARAAAAGLAWQRLIQTHTHEQGVWHDPRTYPQSWQLDPTEGPGRVRVRLRRAHLHVPPRFLKPQYRYKAESGQRAATLGGVVGAALAARGGLVARLQLNETVTYMARVTCVTVASETPGELLLSDRSVHFVPDDAPPSPPAPPAGAGQASRRREVLPPPAREPAHSWPLHNLVQVVTRRWCLQEVAVELFLNSGHAHLLAFDDVTERSAFLKALAACHLPAKIEPDTLQEAMAAWRSGSITNWEYLMRLNGLAGRSYNDLMQYPVLPFVLADYSSRILDLEDPASFRDLSRPMAIQNKAREQHYINIYNDLKAARREGCSPLSRQPHHYASLYSNSGGVLHYLVRLPPFTELFLNYQDNNFDMPDRTFHSLATTWRLITNDSPTDVKELIPELFYLPELFHNNEGLNLGVRQCGAGVDSVELPPWALDARLFTLIHRQALEARAVTERLPAWIDLVFGYKQTGQAAIDAVNVFPACTYYGFDPSSLEDDVDRLAAASMVRTYGQAPRQLLRAPHPHAAASLRAERAPPAAWPGLRAPRWGNYCGAPGAAPPAPAARRPLPAAAALRPLPHARAVAAAATNTAPLPLHDDAEGPTGGTTTLGLMSWGHSDNIVRLKRRRDAAPELLLHIPNIDRITVVWTWVSGGGSPWRGALGLSSGRVLALRARVCGGAVRVRTRVLVAHAAPISALYACASAALLVSASIDGNIVLWDLNQLTYIRSLPNRDMSRVTHATISPTLCDVATVHDVTSRVHSDLTTPDCDEEGTFEYEKDAAHKYKSLIRVHTVNGSFVGSVKVPELVTCVCYSGAPEGVSINSLAAGLSSGAVRLYSSWDLRHTITIAPVARSPLLSITYSSDSMLLFGCYEGGIVVAWEANESGKSAPIRIHPAHALIGQLLVND